LGSKEYNKAISSTPGFTGKLAVETMTKTPVRSLSFNILAVAAVTKEDSQFDAPTGSEIAIDS